MQKHQRFVSENQSIRDKKPPHWPEHVRFITAPFYHASVIPAVHQHIEGTSAAKDCWKSRCNNMKVIIRKIDDASHPAFGQFGLFAGQKIPKKTHIIDYLGEVHCDDRPNSNYDLSLCRLENGVTVGIDATSMGNQARFINDYRRIATRPNAFFVEERIHSGVLCMSIWSGNLEIKKGQEVLVSYGKSWWQSRQTASAEDAEEPDPLQ